MAPERMPFAKATARSGSFVTSVRGTGSPTCRAASSWTSFRRATSSAPGSFTQKPPATRMAPESAADHSAIGECAVRGVQRPGLHGWRAPPPDRADLRGVEGPSAVLEEASRLASSSEPSMEPGLGEAGREDRNRAQAEVGDLERDGHGVLVAGRAGDEHDLARAAGSSQSLPPRVGEMLSETKGLPLTISTLNF